MAEVLAFPGAAGTAGSEAPVQCQRLARVLLLTREMLELARADDWDAVADCERRRRDDLGQCFSEPTPEAHGELVAEALAALLHLNEELMALLATAREAALAQGARQARTRSAIDRYRDMGGH